MRPLETLWSGADARPFALLYRPETAPGVLEVLTGDVTELERLDELPPVDPLGGRHQTLAALPYRQIGERGFVYPEDHAPLLALAVDDRWTVPLDEAIRQLPDEPIELTDAGFDVDDDAYADVVRRLITDEIGRGEGANFVVKRSFTARIADYSPRHACTLLRRLLLQEDSAYWTFAVHTGERTFVGASPERHISLRAGTAVMNPISGTYRYPDDGPTLAGALEFLSDTKESEELYMVVDEELKMMAAVCDGGGRVVGPRLKEMAHLAHTEYFIEGHSSRPVPEVLRRTLFAPTVTGSPLESACRAIDRYEPEGRGYYCGALALIGADEQGRQELDSAILIRTARIDRSGELTLGVGATVVRHSDPAAEAAETRAKAAGMLRALRSTPSGTAAGASVPNTAAPVRRSLADEPSVRHALEERNRGLARFWLAEEGDGAPVTKPAPGRAPESVLAASRLSAAQHILVIDAEDSFTAMLAHQIRSLGPEVTVRRFGEPFTSAAYDLVLAGPGPGDPGDLGHPKIAALRTALREVLADRRPLLAVCLGHQVLSGLLGLELARLERPNQGVRREIDLFGEQVRVGFYNTFAARSHSDTLQPHALGRPVEVCRDKATGDVHALRAPGLRSFQFHPESVLSADGLGVLAQALEQLLPPGAHFPRPATPSVTVSSTPK
ncbi:anthranilate synthase family protein [Streptomyces albidus (ex Kaewkla and Franco 2022)]|uniref:anthranilate synthase family protein n=1 Tax=Streptomyces albidus (ex Kaewkla and Franco 2022) TaxID=722709 RepID=UPI0015EE5147|nr:chorismate-binding protein [Streptomyces albidus (ex Kaewkla and Franco 2022)]